ncbi:MAG: MFS transporter, partial [Acidimicrobiia bacterium]
MFRRVVRVARLRGLAAAYLLFAFAEFGTWVAISIYAYDRGGATEAGFALGLQLTIAALAAPLMGYVGDRVRRDWALVGAMVAAGVTSVCVAVAMSADSSAVVVY